MKSEAGLAAKVTHFRSGSRRAGGLRFANARPAVRQRAFLRVSRAGRAAPPSAGSGFWVALSRRQMHQNASVCKTISAFWRRRSEWAGAGLEFHANCRKRRMSEPANGRLMGPRKGGSLWQASSASGARGAQFGAFQLRARFRFGPFPPLNGRRLCHLMSASVVARRLSVAALRKAAQLVATASPSGAPIAPN